MSQLPGDPSRWSDDQWLTVMAESLPEKPAAKAVAIVGTWNVVRERSQGGRYAIGTVAAPYTDDSRAVQDLARSVMGQALVGDVYDVVVMIVPPGTGQTVQAAVRESIA